MEAFTCTVYSLQKKLADSSLLFNVLSILIKVGCSIPGGTVCRSCIATVQHNSKAQAFLKISEDSNFGFVNYDNQS